MRAAIICSTDISPPGMRPTVEAPEVVCVVTVWVVAVALEGRLIGFTRRLISPRGERLTVTGFSTPFCSSSMRIVPVPRGSSDVKRSQSKTVIFNGSRGLFEYSMNVSFQ